MTEPDPQQYLAIVAGAAGVIVVSWGLFVLHMNERGYRWISKREHAIQTALAAYGLKLVIRGPSDAAPCEVRYAVEQTVDPKFHRDVIPLGGWKTMTHLKALQDGKLDVYEFWDQWKTRPSDEPTFTIPPRKS